MIEKLQKQYDDYCKQKSLEGYQYGWHESDVWDFLKQHEVEVANINNTVNAN